MRSSPGMPSLSSHYMSTQAQNPYDYPLGRGDKISAYEEPSPSPVPLHLGSPMISRPDAPQCLPTTQHPSRNKQLAVCSVRSVERESLFEKTAYPSSLPGTTNTHSDIPTWDIARENTARRVSRFCSLPSFEMQQFKPHIKAPEASTVTPRISPTFRKCHELVASIPILIVTSLSPGTTTEIVISFR